MNKLEITKQEAMLIIHFMHESMLKDPNYLQQSIDVVTQTTVKTTDLLGKLLAFVTKLPGNENGVSINDI